MRKKVFSIIDSIRGINFTKEIVSAFLIGGLLMTALNPIFVPPIQDFQKDVGIISTPTPEIDIQYQDNITDTYIQRSTEVDPNKSEHRTFYVKVKNPTNKIMTDVNILVLFSGCPEKVGIAHTNLDSVFTSREADGLDTGRLLGGCGASFDIEELAPKKSVMAYTVINTTITNNQISEGERLDNREIALLGNYEWTYNGRTYYQSIELRGKVDDKLEPTDQLN